MNDLISRKAVLEEVESLQVTITGLRAGKSVLQDFANEYRKSVLRIIQDAPAVEAEPIKLQIPENVDEEALLETLKNARVRIVPDEPIKMNLEVTV